MQNNLLFLEGATVRLRLLLNDLAPHSSPSANRTSFIPSCEQTGGPLELDPIILVRSFLSSQRNWSSRHYYRYSHKSYH
jgi:hypothetical protein